MVNNRFGMKRFMDRIGAGSQNNNSMVSMGTIEALKELSKEKLGKGEMASRAAAVVAAGGSGGGGMMPGSHYGGVGGGSEHLLGMERMRKELEKDLYNMTINLIWSGDTRIAEQCII